MGILDSKKVETEIVTMIGTVAVDASIHEVHSMSGTATEHPVETGSNISDHYKVNARTVKIDGIITNQPLHTPLTQAGAVGEIEREFTWEANPDILGTQIAGPGILGTVAGAIMSATGMNKQSGKARAFSQVFNRVMDTLDEFDTMRDLGTPIDIYTTYRIYHNMVIESFDWDRDKSTASCLKFSMMAKQIRVVETKTVVAPEPTVERAKPKKDEGKRQAAEAESEVASGSQSLLAGGTDAVVDAVF